MRKTFGIVIFLLTLLPLIGSGDAFTIKAQNFTFENGEYWLPDINVEPKQKVRCESCGQEFDDDEAFDRHLKYTTVCADYYGINNNSDKDGDDDTINGYCCFCGLPEDRCTCTGAECNGSYNGGDSGLGGETIIIDNNIENETGKWFDDVVDTPDTTSNRQYTPEQELEFAKQISKTIRKLIEKLEKEGRIKYSDKDINCHYNPKTGCLILPANSDFTPGGVVHELIHYIQDQLGVLNYDICGSDNEYEAYVVNYIFMTAIGEVDYTASGLKGHSIWDVFTDLVVNCCKYTDGVAMYTPDFLSALNNLNHVELSEYFRNYWENIDNNNGSDSRSLYYKYHDSNYCWNWRDILNFLGFKENR